jgi:beta-phosphoglucomutase
MLKAIIFDCDGVIVDSEPHHMKALQLVLEGEGISLSKEEYYRKYLAMDDKGCFETALADHQRPINNAILKKLIIQKMALYRTLSQQALFLYPGVVEFVNKAVGTYRLAIASGAFRGEIKFALDKGGMRAAFPVIVSAQDVKNGKPHPEAFLTALAKLNERTPGIPPILASECVVIEDSLHGVEAARSAGMSCLAITNSYSAEQLQGKADRIIKSLTEIEPKELEALCSR